MLKRVIQFWFGGRLGCYDWLELFSFSLHCAFETILVSTNPKWPTLQGRGSLFLSPGFIRSRLLQSYRYHRLCCRAWLWIFTYISNPK